jgi:hypothetical protein
MVLTLPADPDETVQADWLPFKKGEVMYTDGIKTSGFIRGYPSTPLLYITRMALMHSL